MKIPTIQEELNRIWASFNTAQFIKQDPIQVVHRMAQRTNNIADIEICAMLTSMIAWGNRSQIISTANKLMDECNWEPHEYIKLGEFYDIPDDRCIYRTLKGKAFKEVCHELRQLYYKNNSIQELVSKKTGQVTLEQLLMSLCDLFEPARLGSPSRNSACKRINMLLRWMVRKDDIDLGLWQTTHISPSSLFAIMDTHVAQQAQRMGLISYPKESWKAVLELTHVYRTWDLQDPLKYDFVLMTKDL